MKLSNKYFIVTAKHQYRTFQSSTDGRRRQVLEKDLTGKGNTRDAEKRNQFKEDYASRPATHALAHTRMAY